MCGGGGIVLHATTPPHHNDDGSGRKTMCVASGALTKDPAAAVCGLITVH